MVVERRKTSLLLQQQRIFIMNKDMDRSKEDLIKELSLLRRRLGDKKDGEVRDKEADSLSRTFYRAIEESPVSVIITDRDGAIEYINPKCVELTGYSLEEARGENPRMWKSGEHPPELYKEIWDTILSGKVWRGRLHNKKKNGELYWEEASISPLVDEKGVITNFLAIKEDVTAKRKAEENLLASLKQRKDLANKFRTIFESSSDAIMLLDKEGFFDCNKATLKMFGCSRKDEFLKAHTSEWSPITQPDGSDSNEAAQANIDMAFHEGRQFFEWSHRRADGTVFPAEVQLTRMRLAGRDVLQAIVRDITKRKRAEHEMLESKARLNEAEKVAGIGYYVLDVKSGLWTNSQTLDDIFGIDSGFKRNMQGWLDIIHPDHRDDMLSYFQNNVLGQKQKFDMEYKIINLSTSQERWVHGLGTLKFDDKGEPIEMFGTILDITARKQAEQEARREKETMHNLLMLSEATSSIADIDELMKSVVSITRDITTTDLVMSYVWDADRKILRPTEAAGLASDMLPFFKTEPLGLDKALVKGAMDSGSVFMETRAEGKGPLKLQQEGLCDWVDNASIIALLPLVGKREYQGMIVCICFGGEKYYSDCLSERKKGLMQAVAHQASIALENARHYKESINRAMELSRKVETIETISTISKEILSTHDLDIVMAHTARMVSRLVPCDWLRIIELDRVREEFTFMAGLEKNRARESVVMSFASTSLTAVVDTKRPEYIADLRGVKSPLRLERDLIKDGYLSVLRIPIIAKREVIGAIGLISRRASAFVPSDLATLEDLSHHVAVALTNARLVRDLEEFSLGTISALARSIDAKSPWTHGHSERVTKIALSIGKNAGLKEKELNDLRIAGLLHDIGKIGTYESILDKHEKLTEEEFLEIKKHPVIGSKILAPIKRLQRVLPAIRSHHEAFDGSGYPDGLSGLEIPLQARILAVSDTVDAMSADRPYREGQPMEVIIEELNRCSGTQFDPAIVDNFIQTINKESELFKTRELVVN